MKKFSKSIKLDKVCYDVRGPVLDAADSMEAEGIEILKLNTGNPGVFGFHVSDSLTKEMSKNLAAADAYSTSKGILQARTAIAEYCREKGIHGVGAGDIYTGNGVSELIMISMQGLLDSGDEILIPAPDYPLWTAAATLAGGKAVHYVCDESSNWYPDIEDMKKKITPRTKGIVVINPNNPTGALYPVEILEKIAELAREHELILFADEIYDRLVMDGKKHVSMASVAPDLFTVTFNGLSKSHRVAGFRVGWMSLSGNKECAKEYIEGLNMLSNMRLCSNVPAQYIIAPALSDKSPDTDLLPGGRLYEQREFITRAINDIPGLSAVKPSAAFYIFPKIDTKRFNIIDDERFVLDFLKSNKILLVHGKGFNMSKPDHFRIVYLPDLRQLEIAAEKMRTFLAGYKQV
jgi:alanine-synthesizing transaminase